MRASYNLQPKLHQATKFAFIDAVRGYAALLVITGHVGGMFSALPWPLKRLTNYGAYGVQLFFLASCVTLLLSWKSGERKQSVSFSGFWLRRFFRIAPMYYLAIPYYYLTEPPSSGFRFLRMIGTMIFMNVWHPSLLPVDRSCWSVVPGGWSIAVEFAFYAIFPVIALSVRSIGKAALFFVSALLFACLVNPILADAMSGSYNQIAVEEFSYYWFPNQLPVFALGTILYFLLEYFQAFPQSKIPSLFLNHSTSIVVLCIVASIAVGSLVQGNLPLGLPSILPKFVIASLVFMVAVLALASDEFSPFVNQFIRKVGEVSFSAYIVHFSVLHKLVTSLPHIFDVHTSQWRAIIMFLLLWTATTAITLILANVTFRSVERPMIRLGRWVIAQRFAKL